jgi:hypothetical protein
MSKRTTQNIQPVESYAAEKHVRGSSLEHRQTEGLIHRWLRLANDLFDQDSDNDPTPSAA